jgi:hypothetical protein
MQHWHWSDLDRPLGRWSLFFRSAEFLTTAFLWGYAAVLLADGATIAAFPAFAWLRQISGGDERWMVACVCLAVLAPAAVLLDDGRLRGLSMISQGVAFLFMGLSAWFNSPLGLGWVTFGASGLWLLIRSAMLLWSNDFLLLRTIWRRGIRHRRPHAAGRG